MRQVDLLTRVGTYVVTVQVPAFNPIPEVLVWGDRVFVRRADDKYYEGMAWAVFTEEERRRLQLPEVEDAAR